MCLLVPSLIPVGDYAAPLYTRGNTPTGKVKQPFSNPLITLRLTIYHSSAGFVLPVFVPGGWGWSSGS